MQWQDEGIVLKKKILGEEAWVVTLLTREHGLHKGMWKGRRGERPSPGRQPLTVGDAVAALWTARLAEQLGRWSLDIEASVGPFVLKDPARLKGLMIFGELLALVLAERTPCPEMFTEAEKFLQTLKTGEDWVRSYLLLELVLLRRAGFGLDFQDAALATEENPLTYVSPKTGRVVTRSKGEPYQKRLLRLPSFLRSQALTSNSLEEAFSFNKTFLYHCLPPESYASFYVLRETMTRCLT